MSLTFHIVTLLPESFESYVNASILKRAQEKKKISIKYYNPRDFAIPAKNGKGLSHAERRIDDRPYGGGPGMVIEALPVIRAIEKAVGKSKVRKVAGQKSKIIFFSPGGKQFDNKTAEKFKEYSDIILICGHYEGIDARVKKVFPMTDISVGSYILTGGELPAMIVIDAITRRISGVLGDDMSIEELRTSSNDVYTRPAEIIYKKKKYKVPKILLSGHHADIEQWKKLKNNYNLALAGGDFSND